MRKFVIDLFCGAGGMTCGLANAGYVVVAGVDKEERCRKTYSQNKNCDGSVPDFMAFDLFQNTENYPEGQQEIAIKALKQCLKKRGYAKKNGDILLLAICAPCQPFTRITKIELSRKRYSDRSRDKDLLPASLGVIKALRPDAVVCENVEGICKRDQDIEILKCFTDELDSLKYMVDVKIINVKNFGVAQNRRRTIIMGYRKKKFSMSPAIPEKNKRAKPRTVGDVIGGLPPLTAGQAHPRIRNHRTRSLSDLNLKRISSAIPGETNGYLKNTPYGDLSLYCHNKMKNPSFSDTYTRMAEDCVSPTITTKFLSITNGRFGHFDVNQNRALSIREGAMLQTFPKSYVFYPEDNLQLSATLIGNAIPPKVAKFIGEHIANDIMRSVCETSL